MIDKEMQIGEWGKAIIPEADIMISRLSIPCLLKGLGATVLGIVEPYPDMVNYEWHSHVGAFDKNYYFSWKRIK